MRAERIGGISMKYYDIKPIAAKGCQYNIIYGGRASGKSYQMATYLLDDYLDNGHQFVRLLRSWGQGKSLDTYFNEIIANDPKKYAGVKVELTNEMGFRYLCNGEVFGYVIPLSLEYNYKSNQYPEVVNVVFEEFVAPTPDAYLDGNVEEEIRAFKSVISTIFRHREGRVWLVGNSMNTSNPYFELFGIDGSTLKVGDLKKYTRMITVKGKSVPAASVAVEFVPIGYTDPNEVPIMLRLPDNEIAITGAIEESKNVTDKIHRVYNESGYIIGVEIDDVNPYCNPIFTWDGDSGTQYYIVQTFSGDFYICESGDPTPNDIVLTPKDPTPEMVRCCDSRKVKSPNYVDETGVAANRVYFNSASSEFHYMTDVAKWLDNDKQIKKLGLVGGCDTSTQDGRNKLKQLAETKPGYIMNELANKYDFRK